MAALFRDEPETATPAQSMVRSVHDARRMRLAGDLDGAEPVGRRRSRERGTGHVESHPVQPGPRGGVTVTLAPRAGDAGSAVQGVDYTLPGPFTIGEGSSEATADIVIVDNPVNEVDKTIKLTVTTTIANDAPSWRRSSCCSRSPHQFRLNPSHHQR